MRRKEIVTVFILLSWLSNVFAHNEQSSPDKNILILFSLQPTAPAYQHILDGIRITFRNEFGSSQNIHTEYLESDLYPQGNYPEDRFALYNEKYRDVKLDLLICVGVNLVEILKSHAESYLLSLPAVSIDLDFSSYGINWDIMLNDKTTAIPLTFNAKKTIATILELMPETEEIFFISGVSFADNIFSSVAHQEAGKIGNGIKLNFISDYAMDDILVLVSKLPEKSIIIIPNFSADSKGVPYFNPESVRLISRSAVVPVFTFTTSGFGEGAVGGYILDYSRAGMITGEAVVKILRGIDPKSIHYAEKDYYKHIYDWRELKRWGLINSPGIPKGSMIMYKEDRFLAKYRWIITGGVLFIFLQTLLIIRLVRMNRRQKLMTLQIKETENKFRELAREDRILRMGQLTASLSHELNQPLTSILSTAQAGLRFVESNNYTPELLKEIFHNIAEDDKRTASILGSIRGMMKLEKRDKEIVNIQKIIGEIVAISRSETEVTKNELEISLPEDPVYILADPIQIQQVLLNFILNASQSNQRKNGTNKKIIISASCEQDLVTISVRDYGEGLSEEVQKRLFKPFATSKAEGFGVGLAISRSIIDDHHGKIWAENMPEGGARFSFSLKIHEDGK